MPKKRFKTTNLNIRLSETELEMAKKKAETAEKSLSEWVRWLIAIQGLKT